MLKLINALKDGIPYKEYLKKVYEENHDLY